MNIMQTARNLSKNQLFVAFGLIALAVFLSSNAYAGSGGAEFDDVWSTLVSDGASNVLVLSRHSSELCLYVYPNQ